MSKVVGSNLLIAAREFTTRQRLQHQGRDHSKPEQGDFLGFGIHADCLLSQKHKPGRQL
jgi:hypothetical protein